MVLVPLRLAAAAWGWWWDIAAAPSLLVVPMLKPLESAAATVVLDAVLRCFWFSVIKPPPKPLSVLGMSDIEAAVG